MKKEKEPYINLKKEVAKIKLTLQHDFDSYRIGIINTRNYRDLRLEKIITTIKELQKKLDKDNKKY